MAACTTTINANRDIIIGVKVRLTTDVTDNGKNENEVFRRAVGASKKCQVPLMVHHIMSTIPVQPNPECRTVSCPGQLSSGDVYTHSFHGYPTTIIDNETNTIYPAVHDAKARGVIFDVGHGQGSFSWKVAELAAKENFWPDTISTDMHSGNIHGPVYDLTLVMSRFLHLGMSLRNIIASVTTTPAKVIGMEKKLGSLEVGREADITVLKMVDCDMWLEDSQGQLRNVKKRLVPVAVWRRGKQFVIEDIQNCPSSKLHENVSQEWNKLLVKDEIKPKCTK